MSTHRIRGIATLVGVSALVLAGPTAAAVADSDLQTFEGSQDQQAEDDRQWSLERSEESDTEDTQAEQDSDLGALFEQQEDSSRDARDTTSEDTSASGPAEDFCDTAFADNDDAHAQCMAMAESFPSPDEGGDEEQDPFQQFCDEAFADNDDAHTQCSEIAGTLAPEEEGDDGEDDTTEDDTTDEGGEDDATDEGDEQANPFQQFCDEAFADNEDAHAQCTELAGNFEQDDGGEQANPFQQFCDEAFADNEDAHAQCTELAQALAGEDEGGDGEDDTGEDDTSDGDEDTTGEQDQSGTLDEDQTASPAADSGALPVTGLNVAVASLSGLSLLGMGGALLRRFRTDSLG